MLCDEGIVDNVDLGVQADRTWPTYSQPAKCIEQHKPNSKAWIEVIKCHPNSKMEYPQKNTYICLTRSGTTNLLRFQSARPDHVRVEVQVVVSRRGLVVNT